MKIKYQQFAKREHHTLKIYSPNKRFIGINSYLVKFFSKWFPDYTTQRCSHVNIATDKDEIVGFFRFSIHNYASHCNLVALGTAVLPEYQGGGIATKLWKMAITQYNPSKIWVVTTSKGGKNLVNRILRARCTKDTKWDICNG